MSPTYNKHADKLELFWQWVAMVGGLFLLSNHLEGFQITDWVGVGLIFIALLVPTYCKYTHAWQRNVITIIILVVIFLTLHKLWFK